MKNILFQTDSQRLWLWSSWAENLRTADFLNQIDWRQNQIRMFGKLHLEPRLTCWYGPAYTYSNIAWEAREMPIFMQRLTDKISGICQFEFNAVLCNYYRNGRDAMGWHADNEPEIDPQCIASLSLGAERTFKIKHRSRPLSFDCQLNHGALLVMENMQSDWLHAVPKRMRVIDPRLNFTFRRIASGR
jgi:alkylated DNA repair dioxygenase AlkB